MSSSGSGRSGRRGAAPTGEEPRPALGENSGVRREPAEARLVQLVVDVLRKRWAVAVLARVCVEPTQFNQLQRELAISSKVLSEVLRAMERDGLVSRTPPDHPGKAGSYTLTELSAELQPALRALVEWARTHEKTLEQSRARFDAAAGGRVRRSRRGGRHDNARRAAP